MTALRTAPVRAPLAPKATPGTVVLLHAFSRGERGDGMHVDLSLRLIREALGPEPEIVIHASDAEAFSELGPVVQAPGFNGSFLDTVTGCSRVAAGLSGDRLEFRGGFPELEQAGPSLIIGAAGGYLRTATKLETVKTTVNHLPQVLWAANQPVPSIYLPQSIGPFASGQGRRLRDAVERIDHVFVRDDRTASLFAHHEGLHRAPDLALMELMERLPAQPRDTGHERIYLAVGRLPRNPKHLKSFAERITALRALLPDAEILLDGEEERDKVGNRFYRNLGWDGPFRTVPQALAEGPSGVMVSVGLYNCIRAMMAGWPCFNLAIERKGFGAFSDLNLQDCVRKATCFDPQEVARIAGSLRFARQPFWAPVVKARETCRVAQGEMVELIADAYQKGQNRRRALA